MTFTSKHVSVRNLGSRDRFILDDAIRMRLVTNATVAQRQMPGLTENAVSKITAKLSTDGWLTSHSLCGRRNYFTPGIRSVRAFDLSPKAIRPLGSQGFPTWFAIANFISRMGRDHKVATRDEVLGFYPWIPPELAAQAHIVFPKDQTLELRLLRVDLGGSVRHIASKCKADIERRLAIRQFESLLASKSFVLSILTTTQEKEFALRKEIATHRWPDGLRFQTSVVPELLTAIGME